MPSVSDIRVSKLRVGNVHGEIIEFVLFLELVERASRWVRE